MENATLLRLSFFLVIFAFMALWEIGLPRRSLTVSKKGRWYNNLGIVFFDTLALRLVLPAAALAVAVAAERAGWGLLNYLELPKILSIIIAVFVLDLVIYLQHLMFHAVPLLWRLHMVHHADLDIDFTTGLRFHPIEIIISMLIKMSVVAALGPPVIAVVVFEIILNGTAMFNHGNVRLSLAMDSFLRLLVVTPDMHRVHHSVAIRETNRNFGFNFPWWDRIFGTYQAQPVSGHRNMTIGLSQFRKPEDLTLGKLLVLPYTGYPGKYSLKGIGADPRKLLKKQSQ